MTRRQFDRLPPDERDDWTAEWELDQLTCSTCGNSVEQCSDPERVWYPYRRVCYASMERAGAEARYDRLHDDKTAYQYHDGTFSHWSGKRTSETPFKFDDGVTIGVDSIDRAPWDKFTTKADASPLPPESDGELSEEQAEHHD